jgi:hypothetical protein
MRNLPPALLCCALAASACAPAIVDDEETGGDSTAAVSTANPIDAIHGVVTRLQIDINRPNSVNGGTYQYTILPDFQGLWLGQWLRGLQSQGVNAGVINVESSAQLEVTGDPNDGNLPTRWVGSASPTTPLYSLQDWRTYEDAVFTPYYDINLDATRTSVVKVRDAISLPFVTNGTGNYTEAQEADLVLRLLEKLEEPAPGTTTGEKLGGNIRFYLNMRRWFTMGCPSTPSITATPASQTVQTGTAATVTLAAPTGYALSRYVGGSCGGKLAGARYTVGNVTAPCTEKFFAAATTKDGAQSYVTQSLTITPKAGQGTVTYAISSAGSTCAQTDDDATRTHAELQLAQAAANIIIAAQQHNPPLDHWIGGIRLEEVENTSMRNLLPIYIDVAAMVNAQTGGWLKSHVFLAPGGGMGMVFNGIDQTRCPIEADPYRPQYVKGAYQFTCAVGPNDDAPLPFFARIAEQTGAFAFGYKFFPGGLTSTSLAEMFATTSCPPSATNLVDGHKCNMKDEGDWAYILGDSVNGLGFDDLRTYIQANAAAYPRHANVIFNGDSADSVQTVVTPQLAAGSSCRVASLADDTGLHALRMLFDGGAGWNGRFFMNGYINQDQLHGTIPASEQVLDFGSTLYFVNDSSYAFTAPAPASSGCASSAVTVQSKSLDLWNNWPCKVAGACD